MKAKHSDVLGIDPGLNTTGYAVLELANGTVICAKRASCAVDAKHSLEQRLGEIHDGVSDVIDFASSRR